MVPDVHLIWVPYHIRRIRGVLLVSVVRALHHHVADHVRAHGLDGRDPSCSGGAAAAAYDVREEQAQDTHGAAFVCVKTGTKSEIV